MENTNRKSWIAVANVCSCLGVIILHCNGVFWQFPTGRLWYTSNFIETLFYWSAPVFFMISGATLLDYRERYSTGIYFKKRLLRTLVPFIFWSIVSVIYRYYYCDWEFESLRDTLNGIINTKFMAVYWFFPSLFAVYMAIPLLSAVEKATRLTVFILISGLTFVFNTTLPVIFSLIGLEYNSSIQIPVTGGYLIYVLLGYIISTIEMQFTGRLIVYFLGVVGFLTQFFGTNFLSLSSGEIVQTFKGYLNFPAVLQSVAVFTLFKYSCRKLKSNKIERICLKLSKYTFGVYLTHYYFVDKLPLLMNINAGSIYWRTIGAIFIFIISTILCYVLSKIPMLRKCIGLS